MPRKAEVNKESVKQKDPVLIDEIGDASVIDAVSPNDFVNQAEMEVFMNQKLEIIVARSPIKDDLVVLVPNVNGLNQPIIRGVRTLVKRKYVEALARCSETSYTQRVQNPAFPEQIQMVDTTVPKYPFTVMHDPHPYGYEWLTSITDSM